MVRSVIYHGTVVRTKTMRSAVVLRLVITLGFIGWLSILSVRCSPRSFGPLPNPFKFAMLMKGYGNVCGSHRVKNGLCFIMVRNATL